MVVHSCKPSTWVAEAGDTEYKISPSYTELEVSLRSTQPISKKGGGDRHPVWVVDAVCGRLTLAFMIHSFNSQEKREGVSRATGVCVSLSVFSFQSVRDVKTNSLHLVLKSELSLSYLKEQFCLDNLFPFSTFLDALKWQTMGGSSCDAILHNERK